MCAVQPCRVIRSGVKSIGKRVDQERAPPSSGINMVQPPVQEHGSFPFQGKTLTDCSSVENRFGDFFDCKY